MMAGNLASFGWARAAAAMIRLIRTSLSLAIAAMLLVGCATAPPTDKAALGEIRRIAIPTIYDPARYDVFLGGSGLARRTEDVRAEQLTPLMVGHGLHLGEDITAALEAQLRQRGYDVVRLRVQRRVAQEHLAEYSSLSTDADAVLDIFIEDAGFESTDFSGLLPHVHARARLRRSDGRTLYAQQVYLGPSWTADVEPANVDGHQRFANFARLLQFSADAAAALRAAAGPIARHIVDRLQ
jgi:hypothetical protein